MLIRVIALIALSWTVSLPVRLANALRAWADSIYQSLRRWWHRPPHKRPPRLLTTPWLCGQLLMQAAIIVTVGFLWHLSRIHKGIAIVHDDQQAYFDSRGFHPPPFWNSSIVWTTVPAWILSAYSAFWSAMLEVLTDAHRTLELYTSNLETPLDSHSFTKTEKKSLMKLPILRSMFRPFMAPPDVNPSRKVTTAQRTIMLDYGKWPIICSFKAFHYGHLLLGVCMLLRVALWTADGLSAAIFSIATVPFQNPITLSRNLFFDEYLGYNYGKGSNYSSALTAMDVVSATLVNDGSDYPWTTDTHSFLPFKAEPHLGLGNYTADTEAYSTTVTCNVATLEDLIQINAIDLNNVDEADGSATVSLHFSYRECDVIKALTVSNQTTQYGRSWAVTDCSLAAGQARFGMISAVFSASEKFWLSNLVVVTCQPFFYKAQGSLTVGLSNDSTTAQVLNFTENSREAIWPSFARRWIGDTPYYNVLDPSTFRDVDTFSRLVISHVSRNRTLDTGLPPTQLLSSFEAVFQAYYATFVTLQAYYTADRPQVLDGSVSRAISRLFVITGPAWAVIGIMAFAFFVTMILAFHLHRKQSLLSNHTDTMLGAAVLFHRNVGMDTYIDDLISAVNRQSHRGKIDVAKYAKTNSMRDYSVWMDGDIFHIKRPAQESSTGDGFALNSFQS